MSALKDNGAGSPVGVACSLTEIVAYDSRIGAASGRQWRMPLEAPAADSMSWPSLVNALRTLSQLTGEENGKLAVALLSAISETRRLEMPPLTDDELEMVLSRNAARYFVGARGAQLVSVAALERGKRDGQGVLAAAAPAWIIRLITAAARDAGWSLQKLVPADAAWTIAAVYCWPAAQRNDASLLVHQHDRTDVLQVNGSALTNVRRMRRDVSEVGVLADALLPSPQLLAMGNAAVRKEWLTALSTRGITVTLPTNLPADVSNDAALIAAAFAADVRNMIFRTDEMRAADIKRRTRTMWTMVAAAMLLLAVAGVGKLWDVQRELASVQAAREALKPQLTKTMVGRTSVETVSGQLQMLATTERESPHWSIVIAELTEKLPDDAYLTALRGKSDSVFFDGMATRAAKVFPALEKVQSFAGVKAASQVRREPGDEGDPLERFTLAAKLKVAR